MKSPFLQVKRLESWPFHLVQPNSIFKSSQPLPAGPVQRIQILSWAPPHSPCHSGYPGTRHPAPLRQGLYLQQGVSVN